jgi:hypothetical protein
VDPTEHAILEVSEIAMHDDELQLKAQSALQEFDDARDKTGVGLHELGLKAIDALNAFVDYWQEKPYMQPVSVDVSEGGHVALRDYAERQIGWAQTEKARVSEILTAL